MSVTANRYRVSFGVTEMFWNQVTVIIAQLGKYTKNCRSQGVSYQETAPGKMLCGIYLHCLSSISGFYSNMYQTQFMNLPRFSQRGLMLNATDNPLGRLPGVNHILIGCREEVLTIFAGRLSVSSPWKSCCCCISQVWQLGSAAVAPSLLCSQHNSLSPHPTLLPSASLAPLCY